MTTLPKLPTHGAAGVQTFAMMEAFMPDRRQFLTTAAMTLAAARLGACGTLDADKEQRGLLSALAGAADWINSPAIPVSGMAGKVVLVQFGTYTCINWLRTLPYIRAWARRYTGLAIIGVHTPEFAFEKDIENVRRAIQQMKIEFPLAIDNDYGIWRAFNNNHWPAVYLLDVRGRLRHQQFGEGNYERLERTIQQLLSETGEPADTKVHGPLPAAGIELSADWENLKSPENYLGYARTENFSSPEGRSNRSRLYTAPSGLKLNRWALGGEWTMADQPSHLEKAPGRVTCRFHARDVHLVMGPRRRATPVRFRVSLDLRAPGSAHGLDVDATGVGMAVDQRLYQLIRQPMPIVDRTFEIVFDDPGVEVFSFTFG